MDNKSYRFVTWVGRCFTHTHDLQWKKTRGRNGQMKKDLWRRKQTDVADCVPCCNYVKAGCWLNWSSFIQGRHHNSIWDKEQRMPQTAGVTEWKRGKERNSRKNESQTANRKRSRKEIQYSGLYQTQGSKKSRGLLSSRGWNHFFRHSKHFACWEKLHTQYTKALYEKHTCSIPLIGSCCGPISQMDSRQDCD